MSKGIKAVLAVLVIVVAYITMACTAGRVVHFDKYVDLDGYGLSTYKVECTWVEGSTHASCNSTQARRTYRIEMSPRELKWCEAQLLKANR